MVYVLLSVHLNALCACLLCVHACACSWQELQCTLMMEIIRNFLQLGRWWWCFFFGKGGGGYEWVRTRVEVRLKESLIGWGVGEGLCLTDVRVHGAVAHQSPKFSSVFEGCWW